MNAFVMRERNSAGVYNARQGHWNGGKYVFTHRNPQSGDLYGEDIPEVSDSGHKTYGKWVPAEEVTLV